MKHRSTRQGLYLVENGVKHMLAESEAIRPTVNKSSPLSQSMNSANGIQEGMQSGFGTGSGGEHGGQAFQTFDETLDPIALGICNESWARYLFKRCVPSLPLSSL